MKKMFVITLPIALLLASCVVPPVVPQQCVKLDPVACAPAAKITVTLANHGINPRNYCATAGQPIPVDVAPPNGQPGTVRFIPKNAANGWLQGVNSPNASGFVITPPNGTPPGEYEYYVVFSDGYCIDPRITI